jgi:calcium-dependent protein kinase
MKQYTLHHKLGEGGYASVYKCTDDIGIRYACKILAKQKNKRYRVENEINAMKRMAFSCKVVKLIDACENADNYYIIQEWCRGGTVKDYIDIHYNRKLNIFGENTVASFIRGTLRGLHHMHTEGIIHRDIKAANILLDDTSEDANVKIGDMGTALIIDTEQTTTPDFVGTPWFMAPETLKSEWKTQSDIWSVGVFAYHLLSGVIPFNDINNPYNPRIHAIWRSILFDELDFSTKHWKDVSQEAKDFVKLCLVKDYIARPSAQECLRHEWLTKTDVNDRFKGKPLKCKPFNFEENTLMKAQTLEKTFDY